MFLKLALKQYFGFDEFHPGQEAVIESVLSGHDTLGILPTGTGKSLCYQLPGYLVEGLVVVVSPLIALMEDQVSSLQATGEKRCISLTSHVEPRDRYAILQRLKQYKFLFLSPEMLRTPVVLKALTQVKLAFLVVDEAHCVSQWGIEFRPEYRLLPEVKKQLNNPVTLALTATATKKVAKDIENLLLNDQCQIFRHSSDRPNIAYFVEQPEDKTVWIDHYLQQTQASGLIYCATRQSVEDLYQALSGKIPCGYYHGGLSQDQRRLLQQQFLQGQLQVLIATNAFGMGINKPDLRFVIHYDLPDSPESYLQESGRAGRDGKAAQGILLYQTGDERVQQFFQQKLWEERSGLQALLEGKATAKTDLQEKWLTLMDETNNQELLTELADNALSKDQRLNSMLDYVKTKGCRRQFLLAYFGEDVTETPEVCCDFHGAQLAFFKGEEKTESTTAVTAWQEILLKLF
ncbi:ATP-dependent DNA helicase RecQ [Enterococcus sp. 2201sp1_2201st1_B8_2201SCRN_220225]|uniref:RecQ family ATP-dependent DNA helicase n=1 Tax=unclassified Enterococcus TaxID=2608891 RepID=UPI0034A4286C